MTAQATDPLIHNGNTYWLCDEPLKGYLKEQKISFQWTDTSNWRGYTAGWEIKAGKLFLTRIGGNIRLACGDDVYRRTGKLYYVIPAKPLRELFPEADEDGLFADFVTGTLRCTYGELLHYVHQGHASTYEHELHLQFEKGVLVSEEVRDGVAPPRSEQSEVVASLPDKDRLI